MKYIIFGGSGFIGTHLVQILKISNKDAEIFNLDIVENTHEGKSTFINCDVRKRINVDINAGEDDVVFNFAAIHRTPGHPDYAYFETNILGAENVCKFAEKYQLKKIIFTSSIAPYGAAEEMKEESSLLTPNTPYGISKLVAGKIHQIWQASDSTRELTILRPGVVFGKGENGNFTRLYWGIKGHTFFYPGRKDTIKAAIYVKDLVHFMLYKLENHKKGTEIYNCTYEPAYTIEEIVETMSKVTGLKAPKLVINGKLLKGVAAIIGFLGGGRFGIHPDRVKKLMISTNICGKNLAKSGFNYKYNLETAIQDWYADNDNLYLK
jgi:nucleoside-diphosphate-sugar epimerase